MTKKLADIILPFTAPRNGHLPGDGSEPGKRPLCPQTGRQDAASTRGISRLATSMVAPICLGLIAFTCISSLSAQSEQEIPPPTLPLVAPLPEMVKLTLLLKEEDKPATPQSGMAPPPSLGTESSTWKSIEIQKTGDVRLLKATMMDGKSHDTWILGGKLFDKTFDGNQISCSNYHPLLPSFFQTSNTSFYGTDWIAMENYKGVVTFRGKKCYYFEKNQAAPPPSFVVPVKEGGTAVVAPLPESLLKTWIDVQTKLPVAVTLPEGLVRYRFAPPPQAPLNPPAEYVEYFLRMKKEAERRQREAAIR